MRTGKILRKALAAILLLYMAASVFPVMMKSGKSVTDDISGTNVYKRFYFQGGLHILPGSCISYTWTYMEEGDSVQIVVNGDGTLKTGICRFSDSRKFGTQKSGNFVMTMTVPSSGYYKVFITNPSNEMVSFKGVAVCSRF